MITVTTEEPKPVTREELTATEELAASQRSAASAEPVVAKKVIPSFTGEIMVTFPVTEVAFNFKPKEVTRGALEDRWSYPSPAPTIEELVGEDDQATLDKYIQLGGLAAVVNAVELTYGSLCQDRWKVATGKEPNIQKAAELFATLFHEGKQQREATTSAGYERKFIQYMKLCNEEKQLHGITPKAKELNALAKEMKLKQMAKIQEELNALSL